MKRKLLSMLMGGAVFLAAGAVAAQDSAGSVAEKVAKPAGKPAITAEQRSMLNEKLRLINRIVQTAGADRLGADVTVERQRWLLESLYQMPLAQIRAMRLSGSIDGITHEMTKAKAVAPKMEQPALGGLTSELVYIPISPCRYIDTRNVGGPIVGSRGFDLDLTGTSYGGSASCDPVTNASIGTSGNGAAIAINVAIVSPTAAPGFIGARPVGNTNTTALVNWYQSGPSVQASNAGVVSYDQDSLVTNEIEFFGSPTQIIVDVFGIFAAPTATALDCVSVAPASTSIPANTLSFQFVTATCGAGYTLTGGGCQSDDLRGSLWFFGPQAFTSNTTWLCTYTNPTAAAELVRPMAKCCRTPGR
jgi:hypothetical protein